MNRLTKKSKYEGIYYDVFPEHRWASADTYQRQYSEIVNKLGKFEDFLEEHNVETLADYTKQVRKEVCEEIKKKSERTYTISPSTNKLQKEVLIIPSEILDKIEQGECDE